PAKEVLTSAPPAQEHLEVEDRPQHDTQHRRGCCGRSQPEASRSEPTPAARTGSVAGMQDHLRTGRRKRRKKRQIRLDGRGQTCELWIEKPCAVCLDKRTRRRPLKTGQRDCEEDRSWCTSLVPSAEKNCSPRSTAATWLRWTSTLP